MSIPFWQYEIHSTWYAFDGPLADKIEAAYQNDSTQDYTYTIRGSTFTLSFPTMTQVNIATNYPRQVQRTLLHTPKWFFFDDDWIEYRGVNSNSDTIETLYQAAMTSNDYETFLETDFGFYQLDFSTMEQTNPSSGTSRRIQRIPTIIPPKDNTNLDHFTPIEQYQTILSTNNKHIPFKSTSQPTLLQTFISKQLSKLPQIAHPFGQIHIDDTPLTLFNSTLDSIPTLTEHEFKMIIDNMIQTTNQLNNDDQNQFTTTATTTTTTTSTVTPTSDDEPNDINHDGDNKNNDVDVINNDNNTNTTNTNNLPTTPTPQLDIDCSICHCPIWDLDTDPIFPENQIIQLQCKHIYHKPCLELQLQQSTHTSCAMCKEQFIIRPGPQPPGELILYYSSAPCSGYLTYGTIRMELYFPDGIQDSRHYHPHQPFEGDSRENFLPATPYVLQILLPLYVKAFLLKRLFTIGYSLTRHRDDVLIYTSIPLKSQRTGGKAQHGYPHKDFENEYSEILINHGIILNQDELDCLTQI